MYDSINVTSKNEILKYVPQFYKMYNVGPQRIRYKLYIKKKKKKKSPTKCLDLYFPPSINRDLCKSRVTK